MKKAIPIIILAFVLLFFALPLFRCFLQERKIADFSIDTFDSEINTFPSNIYVQPVCSSQDAVHVAKKIWIEIYGYEVLLKRPYSVSFDQNCKVWLIKGNTKGISFGGIPYLLVHQDGHVIAIWHDK